MAFSPYCIWLPERNEYVALEQNRRGTTKSQVLNPNVQKNKMNILLVVEN